MAQISSLIVTTRELAGPDAKVANRVFGSLLLDAGISSSDEIVDNGPIKTTIDEYKNKFEQSARTFLQEAVGKKQIANRMLYVFGSKNLKGVDLLLLDPKDVKQTAFGRQSFRTIWAGSKLVFVPHDGDVPENASSALEETRSKARDSRWPQEPGHPTHRHASEVLQAHFSTLVGRARM